MSAPTAETIGPVHDRERDNRAVHKRAQRAALLALQRAHPEEYVRLYRAAGGREIPGFLCGDCGKVTPWPTGGARPKRCGPCKAIRDVRGWAAANGLVVPARGRIPSDVLESWRDAHPFAPRLPLEDRLADERARRETREAARRREAENSPVERTCRKCGRVFVTPRMIGRKGRYPSYCPEHRPNQPKPEPAVTVDGRWEVFQPPRRPAPPPPAPEPVKPPRPAPRPPPARGPDIVPTASGGTIDLTVRPSRRDESGRVICGGCDIAIEPEFLSCGCDPGMFDDDGQPSDPRFRAGGQYAGRFDDYVDE